MGSLKVLQAIGTIDAIGGAQRQVLAVCGALDPHRVRSDVAFFLGKGELAAEFRATGAPLMDLTKRLWDPIGVARATALIRKGNYDVIHAHLSRAEIVAGSATALAEAAGARRAAFVLHKHNEDRWWSRRALGFVHRRLTSRADAIVVQSPRLADFYADPALNVSDATRLTVIPYGIDAASFRLPPAAREAARRKIREEQKWEAGAPVVSVIARLVEQKRLDVLLEAWPQVLASVPDARLLIVGRGELQENLFQRAASKDLLSSVRFPGFRSDIPEILAASDALAISSDWEGVPMAMLQAMAASVPVVSTNVAGIADAVTDGKEAVLVPPQSPSALAEGLIATLAQREIAERRAAAAEARVRAEFSLEAAARNWEALYARLCPRV